VAETPGDVCHHALELDVGALQGFLQFVCRLASLARQRTAVARQLPQVALLPRGNEAGPQQPVPQQIGDPMGVCHIGLAPRHRFHVRSVGYQQPEVAFQQVVDGHPVVARRFHRGMSGCMTLEPLYQLHQLRRGGAEVPDFMRRFSPRRSLQYAGHDRALMHVESRTVFVLDLHRMWNVVLSRAGSAPCQDTLTLAFPHKRCRPCFSILCGA